MQHQTLGMHTNKYLLQQYDNNNIINYYRVIWNGNFIKYIALNEKNKINITMNKLCK